MKKIALLAVAIFTFGAAQAQTGPRLGLKAGVTYSNVSGDLQNEDIYKNKFGFMGGITTNFDLSGDGFLSLQPELLYTQKGYQYSDEKFSVGGVDFKVKGDRNFHYLDLPVLLRINAGGLFFEGGPQASYLLSVTDNSEFKRGNESYEETERISKDDLAEFEIGYAAGLGYQLPNGLSLGLRYNGSINKLAKNDGDELANARHSAFILSVGFLFPSR
ncbi:porin family protein [Rufibacter sp. LB8]|uniref:porin family protein n=1 Tax=Rufibacter sp. LB8 TaxID=2777781 RepID=UPI00178C355F|nr:porin family protein [Rufibacter sp. LB8]